jgi:pimeloyl-ACP methyl ester carboxylesterase
MRIFVPIFVVAIAAFAWLVFAAGREPFPWLSPVPRPPEARSVGTLETLWFKAKDGTAIEAWLMMPRAERPPVILMAPGLAGTKEGGLERFAWAFAEAGFATLIFDFRTFGGSEGAPRHWVDPVRQVEDYEAATAFVRAQLSSRVDAERMILWGTSFSGGVALRVAATNPAGLRATIAQVPYLEPSPAQEPTTLDMVRYVSLIAGEKLGDAMAAAFDARLDPVYIPAYGKPGEPVFAKSNDHDSYLNAEEKSLHPFWTAMPKTLRGGWHNRILVRMLPDLDKHRPADQIAAIRTPVMLIGARHDDMIPIASIQRAASRLGVQGNRFVEYDAGHFDVYVDPLFAENAGAQIEFLRSVLADGPNG